MTEEKRYISHKDAGICPIENHSKPYTTQDYYDIAIMINSGEKIKDIAKIVKRTEYAIRALVYQTLYKGIGKPKIYQIRLKKINKIPIAERYTIDGWVNIKDLPTRSKLYIPILEE